MVNNIRLLAGDLVRKERQIPDSQSHCQVDLFTDIMVFQTRPKDYKTTIVMLNSTEHEIYPAHKC